MLPPKAKIIALAAFFFLLFPPFGFAAKASFSYAGWLPFWKKQQGAQDISLNLEKFQELSPFSYEVNPDGTLKDSLRLNQGFWPAWLPPVRDAGVKIIPTVAWFDGQAIHALLSNKKRRIAQENAIAKLVKDMKFDGIDIDYEAKLPETRDYFSLFIQGIAMRLHPMKKTLSCTVEARTPLADLPGGIPTDTRRANNYVVLNRYCGEVRVMAYDQGLVDAKLDASKGNGMLYAPVADPAWAKKTIREALTYISPKKIMLGIATYGYEYEVNWQNGVLTYRRLRTHTYLQALQRAVAVSMVPLRNSAGELNFAYATSTSIDAYGGISSALTWQVPSLEPAFIASTTAQGQYVRYVSFSDAQSAADKIALAKKFGLRGAVFFKFDGEQDPRTWGEMK